MTSTLFTALFLGHLVGDYILQNDWMARNKIKFDSEGWTAASLHCFIYSAVIVSSLFLSGFNIRGLDGFVVCYTIAFLSHFPIDKFSLAKKWMTFYGHSSDFKTNPFVPLVYVAVDNTFHLLIMMGAYSYLLSHAR